jgi:hypothetical protein
MLDSSLQSVLVDRWRPETHTFHLRYGELTSTLKDVSLITGLPICGKPLVPPAFSSDWLDDIRVRLDTEVPNSGARGGRRPRGVPMSWLTQLVHLPHYLLFPDVRRKIFSLCGIQWILMLAIICRKHMRRGIKARVHNGSIPHKYVHISELITPSQPH